MHKPILANPGLDEMHYLPIIIDISYAQNVWLTSDTHFFHKNVIQYCNRPFSDVPSMNSALIENINAEVQPYDTLIMLGDMCFKGAKGWQETIGMLRGLKRLIRGNHDGINRTPLLQMGIEVGYYGSLHVLENEKEKYVFNLSHYPYLNAGDHTTEERFADRRLVDDGVWLLHGHVHTLWQVKEKMINVGVDQWCMKPVNLVEIIKIVEGVNAKTVV